MSRLPGTPTAPLLRGFLRHGRKMQTLEEHDAAEDAINLATWKRRHDETMAAAYRSAADAPTPAEARKILDQASSTVSTIDSPNPRIQQEYAGYYERSQAIWGERFARQEKAKNDKQVHDAGILNAQAKIEEGDEVGAATAYQLLIVREPENRSVYENEIANLPTTIALRGVRGAVADGDYARAKMLMGEAQGLSLTVEQKEDLAKMEGAVNRAAKEQAGMAQIEYLVAANKAAALPSPQREAEIERLKPLLAQSYRTPEEARSTMNWLDAIARGEAFKADPLAALEANALIRRLDADSTVQEIAAAREGILALAPRLGSKVVGYIEELDTRLDGMTTKAIAYAVDDAVAKRRLDPAFEPVMRRDLEKWVNAQKADVSPTDIIERGAVIAAMGPPPKPEAGPFTPGAIQKALGSLMALAADPTVLPEDRADVLVNDIREALGPRWRQYAPWAEQYIKRCSPLNSWYFQTAEEKIATLDRIRSLEASFWGWDSTVLEADITEGDREMAAKLAPAGKNITSKMVRLFEDYLGASDKKLPKPVDGPESLEGWDDLTPEQQAEFKRRLERVQRRQD